jgi:tetratricopeptide (TPR) repeat protein
MKIGSSKLHASHLSANDEAHFRCRTALELKDKGDYRGAREAMGPLWSRVGERPEIGGLHPPVAAEVLLCTGVLLCWMDSKGQVTKAQEAARDCITESMRFYESVGDQQKIASAEAELAYCYWCDGALDEARIMFQKALQKLPTQGNTRARALLGLAVVEWSDSRFNEAFRILDENAFLFRKITNHTIKGTYHNQLALVLRKLAPLNNRGHEIERVIREYEEADHNFKLARNVVFRADVKNNIGFLLYKLSRFKKAHEYLDQARRLTASLKDKIGIAQIDDTRAQVFIAEKKFKEAEAVAKGAVRVLDKSGHQCLLADALITYGIALARLKQTERAQFTFQRAIEVAHQVGALNKAGLAALTLIEEVDELAPDALYAAYDASEWATNSQSPELLRRLNRVARKVFATVRGELKTEASMDAIFNKSCDLQGEVLKFEARLIRRALAQTNGSVTRAARLLGMTYQGLAYVIDHRHKDLVNERSPVRRRSGKRQPDGPPNN